MIGYSDRFSSFSNCKKKEEKNISHSYARVLGDMKFGWIFVQVNNVLFILLRGPYKTSDSAAHYEQHIIICHFFCNLKIYWLLVGLPLETAASSESVAMAPISLFATLIVVNAAQTSVFLTDDLCGWPKITFLRISPDTRQ